MRTYELFSLIYSRLWAVVAFSLLAFVPLQAQEADSATSEAAAAPTEGASTQDAALVSAGEALFKGNCTVCHQINEKLIGPALRDVHKRREVTWIKAFIKNSQKVIESGDAYAVALYEEYNQTQMTSFDFSEEELNSLVSYLISESEKPPPSAAAASSTPAAAAEAAAPATSASPLEMQLLWGAIIVLLFLLLVVLGVFIAFLKSYALQKDIPKEDKTLIEPKEGGLRRTLGSSTFLGFVVFFFVAVVVKSTLDGLFSIGVQQGYAPKQPIAFSHKIHAGQYQIDCNYCHTGVYKSKSANIPSANICMNCHVEIKKESPEIQKIYTAIEKNRPIEWVRVHNLPDLSYFNHSQHVQVGGIACETCHGDIKNMEVVAQHAELTMGWCINCHRETQIQAQDNTYYENLIQIHNSKEPIRVEDIGGLECSKCHY